MPTDDSWRRKIIEAVAKSHGWDLDGARCASCRRRRSTTCSTRRADEKVVVRYRHERGENSYDATFEGVVTNLERRYRETDSECVKTELEKFMVERPCPTCEGSGSSPRRSA